MLSGQQSFENQTAFCKSKTFQKRWVSVPCNYFLKTICLHPLQLIMYRTPAFLSTVSAFWIKMQWMSLSLSRYCSYSHPRVRISCCDYTWWILQRADCTRMTSDRGRGNEVETQRWMPPYLSSRHERAIINYRKIVHWLIVILSGQCLMTYCPFLPSLSLSLQLSLFKLQRNTSECIMMEPLSTSLALRWSIKYISHQDTQLSHLKKLIRTQIRRKAFARLLAPKSFSSNL